MLKSITNKNLVTIELYQIFINLSFFPLKSSPNKKQTRRFREGYWNIRRGEVYFLACDTSGMAVTNSSHSWRSLGWIICFHLVEGKEKSWWNESKRKNFKDAKVSSIFEIPVSTHQQNRNQSCGLFACHDCHDLLLWSNFFVDSRHLDHI